MRVKVSYTVDVNEDAWMQAYGIDVSIGRAAAIRDDVRQYILMSILHSGAGPDYEGLIIDAERTI